MNLLTPNQFLSCRIWSRQTGAPNINSLKTTLVSIHLFVNLTVLIKSSQSQKTQSILIRFYWTWMIDGTAFVLVLQAIQPWHFPTVIDLCFTCTTSPFLIFVLHASPISFFILQAITSTHILHLWIIIIAHFTNLVICFHTDTFPQ